MRTGEDEAFSPKYSVFERERRFLVDRARRPDLAGLAVVRIEDLYLEGTRIRLRHMRDSATGLAVFKLTKKYETADVLARPIVTAYLTEAEFDVFTALPALMLSKLRYRIEAPGGTFAIDVFEGALDGLELAEIEMGDDAALRALTAPDWAIADVSEDCRYQGAHLARLTAPEVSALLAPPIA